MKLKALSMKKKLEFSIPNYQGFYNTFTGLKNATKVSTKPTPTLDQFSNLLGQFVLPAKP